jgi:hypothetical protein
MRLRTQCFSKRRFGASREQRFSAVLEDVDKLFGKNGQRYFPCAAGEESPFAHGLGCGNVPVTSQAKREFAVEGLPQACGQTLQPGRAWTRPVMRGRIVSSRCTTLQVPEVKRDVIAASDTPLVTTAPKAASTGPHAPVLWPGRPGATSEPARRGHRT